MQTFIAICANIIVPIVVALISSGKLASRLEKKFSSHELITRIDSLEKKLDQKEAETYRTRILRFNGEIKRGLHHDEEEFNDCLLAIDGYEDYCRTHPDYPNNKATMAIANVKRVYEKAYQNNDF